MQKLNLQQISYNKRTANLFLLGAPKCATTSLYKLLSKIDSIYCPREKEPHYYFSPHGSNLSSFDYESLYSGAKTSDRYLVDASIWYLFYFKKVATKILENSINPKFIVCIRNPYELAMSLHAQKIQSGHESVASFKRALSYNNERNNGIFTGIVGLPESACPRHMAYINVCMLGEQIKTVLDYIPTQNLKIISFDDFNNNPKETLENLMTFLNIDKPLLPAFPKEGVTHRYRSAYLQTTLNIIGGVKSRYFSGVKPTGLFRHFHGYNKIDISLARPKFSPQCFFTPMQCQAIDNDIEVISRIINHNLDHWKSGSYL